MLLLLGHSCQVATARCGVCIGHDEGFEVSMRSRMLPDSMRVYNIL